MPIKRIDGKPLTRNDKLIYFGVLYNFIRNSESGRIPSKFSTPWVKLMRKANNKDSEIVRNVLLKMFGAHFEAFEGQCFELGMVLESVTKFDVNVLKSLGFDVAGFLKLKPVREIHPDLKGRKVSVAIIKKLKESLLEVGLEVKAVVMDSKLKKVEGTILSLAVSVFTNVDIAHLGNKYIPTISMGNKYLLYFSKSMCYMERINDEYIVNNIDAVGVGGHIVSNMYILPNADTLTSIGIKRTVDDDLYIFKTSYGEEEIEESLLFIEKAYRYTLTMDKQKRTIITAWLSGNIILNSYILDLLDLYIAKPVDVKKTKTIAYPVPKKVVSKSGLVHNIDYTKSFTVSEGEYLIATTNGNSRLVNSKGKKVPFKDVEFILNRNDDVEETTKNYSSLKILL